MASVTPVSLDVISLSSSEEDDDDELQVLSEKIVPVKNTLELTPVEERRLLDQLNIPHNSGSVKIRVKGLAGSAGIGINKRSLLGGVTTAKVKVLTGGRVIVEKNLKTSKIFEPIKKPTQNDITKMFSEVMTISSSDEADPEIDLLCRRNKRFSRINRKKSNQLTDHLVSQQREVADDYIDRAEESVIAQTDVTTEDTTFLESLFNQSEISSSMKSNPPSQENSIETNESSVIVTEGAGPTQPDDPHSMIVESTPIQFEKGDEKEVRKKIHSLTDHLVIQQSLVAQDVEAGQVEEVATSDLITRDVTNVMSSSLCQPGISSINEIFMDARPSSTSSLIQFTPPVAVGQVGLELPLSFMTEDENVDDDNGSLQSHDEKMLLFDFNAIDSCENIEEALNLEDNESGEAFDKGDIKQPDDIVESLASSLSENVASSTSEEILIHEAAGHVATASFGTQTEVLVSIGAQSSNSDDVTHSLLEEDTQDFTSSFSQTKLGDNPSLNNIEESREASTSTFPPSPPKQLDFITSKSGHPFLPTSQLTLLLPPNTHVDVVSLCQDLAAEVLWDRWTVSHVSVPAAIRILDQYGDVFGRREDFVLEQQLYELEKTAAVEKEVDMMNKGEFFARVGLIRVEEYDALAADISYRRETARRTTRLRSGSRRKKPHPEPVRENSAKRGKGKGKRRKKEKINSDVGY